MEQDLEHLKILSIFHYVVGGIVALLSCIPVLHLVMGIVLIVASSQPGPSHDLPPALAGWLIGGMAVFFILAGWACAACVIVAGRRLARRTHRTYCFVIAGIECMFMPFGTILGVFTLVVLSRESVRALFEGDGTSLQ